MKKFLFIFALVVSLVLPGARNVYAAEYEYSDVVDLFDVHFLELLPDSNLSDFPYYVDVCYSTVVGSVTKVSFSRVYANMPILKYDYTSKQFKLSTSDPDNVMIITFDTYPDDSQTDKWRLNVNHLGLTIDSYPFVGSNHDIYHSDGTLVFHRPQKILGIQEPVLIQVITQENPLKEILKLLPMAIPCLVGFVALRKALRTLETILKTA